jgi:hypothetical protein
VNILLVRDLDDGRCTLGTLRRNGTTLQSLERPWKPGPPGGMKGVSCVPPGMYRLVRHDTEAHPRTFALVNEELSVYHYEIPPGTQGRTAVLIHVANWVSEIRGCIALGMERALNGDAWMIRQSRIAIDQFYNHVPWVDGHTIEIRGVL